MRLVLLLKNYLRDLVGMAGVVIKRFLHTIIKTETSLNNTLYVYFLQKSVYFTSRPPSTYIP